MSSTNTLTPEELILILRYNQKDSTRSCPKCNSTVLYYDDFCYNCGTSLKDSKRVRDISYNPINADVYLKYAGVCLLREYIHDPFLFQEFTGSIYNYKPLRIDEVLIHFKPLTVTEVLNYLLLEGYLVVLKGEEKYKSYFSKCPEDYLVYVLKENNIQASSSKEENISLILNKLPAELLEKITSSYIEETSGSNYFEVSEKALKLVEDNKHCLLYDEIFYDFDLNYYDMQFNKSENLKDFSIALIDDSVKDSIEELKWQSYSDLLYKYAQLYDIFKDTDKMLYYTIQHVICEFNPFSDNKIKSKIEIQPSIESRIIYAFSNSQKNYDEIVEVIGKAYDDLKLPKNYISKEDVELLIEELFFTYELRDVTKHLINIFGVERIAADDLTYNSLEEQEKVLKGLEEIFK